jgi:hypothetical protein
MPLLETRGSGSAFGYGLNGKALYPAGSITTSQLQVYYDFYKSSTVPTTTSPIPTIVDSSGNGRNTSSMPAAISYQVDNGIKSLYNATEGTVKYSRAFTFYPSSVTSNFTYGLWLKPTGTISVVTPSQAVQGTSGQRYIIGAEYRGNSGIASYGLSVGTNGIASAEHGPGYMPVLAFYSATINNWSYVTGKVAGGRHYLYLNGVLVYTGLVGSQGTPTASGEWWGEGSNYGSYLGYQGSYEFYNRALSDAEVLANFNATKGAYGY